MADNNNNNNNNNNASNKSESMPKTTEEQLEYIRRAKDKGNELFKNQEYKLALKEYLYANLFLKSILDEPNALAKQFSEKSNPTTNTQKETAITYSISINNNAAAVNFKLQRWDRVVNHSSKVLSFQPNNSKALYRRGKSYLELGKIDEAEVDLLKAIELEPNDASIKKEINILNQKLSAQKQKQQQFYSAMFSQ